MALVEFIDDYLWSSYIKYCTRLLEVMIGLDRGCQSKCLWDAEMKIFNFPSNKVDPKPILETLMQEPFFFFLKLLSVSHKCYRRQVPKSEPWEILPFDMLDWRRRAQHLGKTEKGTIEIGGKKVKHGRCRWSQEKESIRKIARHDTTRLLDDLLIQHYKQWPRYCRSYFIRCKVLQYWYSLILILSFLKRKVADLNMKRSFSLVIS